MDINNVTNNSYDFLNRSSNAEKESEAVEGDLLLDDYLTLMTTQLQYQDPLEPMDNGDFLGQIASFGTVSGIADLNSSFQTFAGSLQSNQALQGSALVGRSVLVPSSVGPMTLEDGLVGQINVADPVTDLSVKIYNESGELVKTMEMGQASGYTNFSWDGTNDAGEALPPGVYQFQATGTVEGEGKRFATAAVAKVESVLVGSGTDGLTINLAGIGSVPFSEAQEII